MSITKYTHCELEYCLQNGRPHSVSGVVTTVPIHHINQFILEGLAHEPYKRVMYEKDVCYIIADASLMKQNLDLFTAVQHAAFGREFLRIAKPFFKVAVTLKETADYPICSNCACPTLRKEEDELRCSRCGTMQTTRRSIQHNYRIISTSTEISGFIESIQFIESLTPLPQNVTAYMIPLLDSYFRERNIPTSADASGLALHIDGTKEHTSMEKMVAGIRHLKRAHLNCINYANYLCTIYWGWKPLNVTLVREQLILNHSLFVIHVEEVLVKYGRIKNIMNQFCIFNHLERMGHPVASSHFRFVKTQNVVDMHLTIFGEVCRRAGLYIHSTPSNSKQ